MVILEAKITEEGLTYFHFAPLLLLKSSLHRLSY